MFYAGGECVHSYIEGGGGGGCYKVGWLGKLLPTHSTPCFVSLYDLKLLNFRNNKASTTFLRIVPDSYFELTLLHLSNVLSNALVGIIQQWPLW